MDPFTAIGLVASVVGVIKFAKDTKSGVPTSSPASQSRPSNHRARTPRFSPNPSSGVREIQHGAFPVAPWLQRHGWDFRDGFYQGYFVARNHRIKGKVQWRNDEFMLFLHDPPSWATSGSHSQCWHERTGGWWFLHLNSSPPNVVAAILGCQGFLERKLIERSA